jgi:hypothetical protein
MVPIDTSAVEQSFQVEGEMLQTGGPVHFLFRPDSLPIESFRLQHGATPVSVRWAWSWSTCWASADWFIHFLAAIMLQVAARLRAELKPVAHSIEAGSSATLTRVNVQRLPSCGGMTSPCLLAENQAVRAVLLASATVADFDPKY